MKDYIRDNYINREYSWLLFNTRVLNESRDNNNPLLEKCKFLSIFSSNLDEFYMVRVGSLCNQNIVSPDLKENKTGLTASEQLEIIYDQTKSLYKTSGEIFKSLRSELKDSGIKLLKAGSLSSSQKLEVNKYFASSVLPLLSPMVLDFKHPMIRFENMHSYFMYKLKKGDRSMVGVMPLPSKLPRLFRLSGQKVVLITMEDILRECGAQVFEGYQITCTALVRVTRNADFDTSENDVDSEYDYDFSKYLKGKVEMRSSLKVVRLEIDEDSDDIKKFLLDNLDIKNKQCFTVKSYFDYKFMFNLENYLTASEAAALKFAPFKPKIAPEFENGMLIDRALSKDIFLAYPYDSFSTLVNLLNECAVSRDVKSIKIAIYRLDERSKIVDALVKASENGIDVTAVLELAARFDEENNMQYSKLLSEAGCTVIYGMGDYKVHAKIISIVLMKGDEVRYITHLGTGNYNEKTSRQYTDLNVITANEQIGLDANMFFRNLAIGRISNTYNKLLIAPLGLKSGLLACIDRQIEKAQSGEKAVIIAKMNSLTDLDMIDHFIAAGKAGVEVKLIVRGICCLAPSCNIGNISVISIVGRFLEHSRVYCFGEGEECVMYISSADLMTRNTDKRVEIATPILDSEIKQKIYDMLKLMLSDNVKARALMPNGTYVRVTREDSDPIIDSQNEYFK